MTVETVHGAVEIPSKPANVVALGWSDAEAALALGVQPAGLSDWQGYGGKGSAHGPRTWSKGNRRTSARWRSATRPSPTSTPTSS
ncbi:hypothetical protein ACFQXA_03155 [Nocardiopsis composta]